MYGKTLKGVKTCSKVEAIKHKLVAKVLQYTCYAK